MAFAGEPHGKRKEEHDAASQARKGRRQAGPLDRGSDGETAHGPVIVESLVAGLGIHLPANKGRIPTRAPQPLVLHHDPGLREILIVRERTLDAFRLHEDER